MQTYFIPIGQVSSLIIDDSSDMAHCCDPINYGVPECYPVYQVCLLLRWYAYALTTLTGCLY